MRVDHADRDLVHSGELHVRTNWICGIIPIQILIATREAMVNAASNSRGLLKQKRGSHAPIA